MKWIGMKRPIVLLRLLSWSLSLLLSHSSSYFGNSFRGGAFSSMLIESEPHYQPPYQIENLDEHIDASQYQRALILMDQFTPYHGGYLAYQARKLYNVTIVNVLSNYMAGYLYQQMDGEEEEEIIYQTLSAKVPLHPSEGSSSSDHYAMDPQTTMVGADLSEQDVAQTRRWKEKIQFLDIVGIICESDSGLDDAERLGVALGLHPHRHDGYNRDRRDKYLMNQCVAKSGLRTVRQKLCFTEEEAVEFAKELGVQEDEEEDLNLSDTYPMSMSPASTNGGGMADGLLGVGSNNPSAQLNNNRLFCVVKPRRGVASDDVHLCKSILSVRQAFCKVLGSIIFASTSGGGRNKHDSVLVQEFAQGTEYAVDVISKNGCHKIAALWRYDKRPVNGAPFVYHATELIDATTSPRTKDLCEYVKNVLDSLGIRWGMTHNEVIVDEIGPRLVEVNCRQHNTDFAPLTSISIGYNALDMLLAAYLDGDHQNDGALTWDEFPELPSTKVYCAIVHLVSHVEGTIEGIRQDLIELVSALPSVVAMEIYPHFSIGASINKTVDITTDAGWVHLVNDDKDQFQGDYETILSLMPEFFSVNSNSHV